ncbi:hypothetical protein [Celeribacter sp. ULVN23_4]
MDIETIKQAIEFAGTSGTAVKNLGSGIESIKSAFSSKSKEIPSEVKDLLVTLSSNVADAKLANADLKLKLADLQTELEKRVSFERRKARYKLIQTPAGNLLYQLQTDMAEGEPLHYACPICMEKDQISILQGDSSGVRCIPCDHWYEISSSSSSSYIEDHDYNVFP